MDSEKDDNQKNKKNYDDIIKLLQQEKYERLHNNVTKHLEICYKIVTLR
jgi:hypothetical protein